jgi:hypothetical protein
MMDLLESSSDRLAAPNKISKKNLTKSLMVAKKVSKLAEVGDWRRRGKDKGFLEWAILTSKSGTWGACSTSPLIGDWECCNAPVSGGPSIAPGLPGFDIGTFDCTGCHPVLTATIETDPIKSDAVPWLAGYDLKSPTQAIDSWREDAMEEFMRRENLIIFRRQLALAKDDAQRQLLLKLIAKEEAKVPVATR